MPEKPYLSVIIISYNDDEIIGDTIGAVTNFLATQNYPSEVIVSDGSSVKEKELATGKIVEKAKAKFPNISFHHNQKSKGKGSLVRFGMGIARGDYKLFMDHDNATPFEQISKLLEAAKENDIVLASRYIKGAKIVPKRSFLRTFVSRGGNIVINFILRLPFKDTRCGFKLYSVKAADIVFPRQLLEGFGFDDEVLVIARKHGLKITEVPVEWHDIETLKGIPSHVSLGDIFKSFLEMGQIKLNLWKGKYR